MTVWNQGKLALALCLPLLLSCRPESRCDLCPETAERATLQVTIGPEGSTRAGTTAEGFPFENAVRDVQVFVFDEDGRLDSAAELGNATKGTVTATTGRKRVWAAVNFPRLLILTEQELLAVRHSLQSNDRNGDGFLMSGTVSCELTGGDNRVEIPVARYASRVCVKEIRCALPAPYGGMTVRKVFLTHVNGTDNFGATSGIDPSGFLNPGSDAGHCPDLLSHPLSQTVGNGSGWTPAEPLLMYCYRNGGADRTRLVVEAEIGGKTWWYPVALDNLERNRSTNVTLTVTSLGSDSPDKTVEKGTVQATVTVAGWEAGPDYSESI